uniref:Variant surface glycoprotein 641 n=1 Tax=Trypanosoma brucei TaxID=5691 RepID=M4T268_9TRYP|nr:variant surface glycoprotein 641 [Trypanosoma brucei]
MMKSKLFIVCTIFELSAASHAEVQFTNTPRANCAEACKCQQRLTALIDHVKSSVTMATQKVAANSDITSKLVALSLSSDKRRRAKYGPMAAIALQKAAEGSKLLADNAKAAGDLIDHLTRLHAAYNALRGTAVATNAAKITPGSSSDFTNGAITGTTHSVTKHAECPAAEAPDSDTITDKNFNTKQGVAIPVLHGAVKIKCTDRAGTGACTAVLQNTDYLHIKLDRHETTAFNAPDTAMQTNTEKIIMKLTDHLTHVTDEHTDGNISAGFKAVKQIETIRDLTSGDTYLTDTNLKRLVATLALELRPTTKIEAENEKAVQKEIVTLYGNSATDLAERVLAKLHTETVTYYNDNKEQTGKLSDVTNSGNLATAAAAGLFKLGAAGESKCDTSSDQTKENSSKKTDSDDKTGEKKDGDNTAATECTSTEEGKCDKTKCTWNKEKSEYKVKEGTVIISAVIKAPLFLAVLLLYLIL